MAMMTVRKCAVRNPPWSRAKLGRASACGLKIARSLKGARGLKSDRGRDICGDQLECRCEDDACLARQAGPGPRI
jgi:hypothetical protein